MTWWVVPVTLPAPQSPRSPRQQQQAVSHLSPLWTSGKVCLSRGVHLLLSGSGGKGWYFLGRVTGGLCEESQRGTEKVCHTGGSSDPEFPQPWPPRPVSETSVSRCGHFAGWPTPSRRLHTSDSQTSREPASRTAVFALALFPHVICYRWPFVPQRATTCLSCRRPGDKL